MTSPLVERSAPVATLAVAALLLSVPFSVLLPAASAAAQPSGMRWGMNVPSIEPLTEAGAKPDFAMTWVGIWNRNNWDSPARAFQTMRAAGVTPVVQWYYWGDDISESCVEKGCQSSLHGGGKTKSDWNAMATKLADLIRQEMGGRETIVVLETEFNKNGIDSSSYAPVFDAYLAKQAATFDAVPGVKVVLGFGSWGSDRWTRFPSAVAASDYVGFQALRSSVRQSAEQYTGVVGHVVGVAGTMNAKFPGKPVFITDLAFSSYPEPEWAGHQRRVVAELWAQVGELKSRGVEGLMYRSLVDVDMNTANYHGEAERWWGLKHRDGSPKPAYQAWLDGVGAVPPPPPPGKPVPARLEAETMIAKVGGRQTDSKASGGAAWNLWSNGDLSEWIAAPHAGTYDVTVRARGSVAAGGWPIFTLSVGGAPVATFTAASTTYQEHTARVTLPAGASTHLKVTYTNDHRTSTEDRNLIVDHMEVASLNQPPTARFTWSATHLAAAFDGSTSKDPEGGPLAYAWEFGDGGTSTSPKPARTYAKEGTYVVKLTVTDPLGAKASTTGSVTVARANTPPAPAFSWTASDLDARLDATMTTDSEGDPVAYAWDFGDGSTGAGPTPLKTYATGGSYAVRLTATDDRGASASVTRTVIVNRAPLAAFSTSAEHLVVEADASKSSDPDGDGLSYAWDFGDGGKATGLRATRTYAAPGTYLVTLDVSDGRATTRATATLTVTGPPAAAAADASGKVEAESFATRAVGGRLTDSGASGGAGWNVWANGAIRHPWTVDETGPYVVVVRAKGTPLGGEYPLFDLRVDGAAVGGARVGSSWADYAFLVPFTAWKSREVSVVFTNDALTSAEDRNLHVDYVSVARASREVVEAEVFATRTAGGRSSDGDATGGAFWNLWANGHLETTITPPAAGTYTLEVVARGRLASGVAPRMVVSVDGNEVMTADVAPGSFEAHRVTLRLAGDAQVVRIAYVNDLKIGNEDRNLHVDYLALVPAPTR